VSYRSSPISEPTAPPAPAPVSVATNRGAGLSVGFPILVDAVRTSGIAGQFPRSRLSAVRGPGRRYRGCDGLVSRKSNLNLPGAADGNHGALNAALVDRLLVRGQLVADGL
jgi:hypothetical protein